MYRERPVTPVEVKIVLSAGKRLPSLGLFRILKKGKATLFREVILIIDRCEVINRQDMNINSLRGE